MSARSTHGRWRSGLRSRRVDAERAERGGKAGGGDWYRQIIRGIRVEPLIVARRRLRRWTCGSRGTARNVGWFRLWHEAAVAVVVDARADDGGLEDPGGALVV